MIQERQNEILSKQKLFLFEKSAFFDFQISKKKISSI